MTRNQILIKELIQFFNKAYCLILPNTICETEINLKLAISDYLILC